MSSILKAFDGLSYLELLAAGTPAVAVCGALDLIGGDRCAWVLAPRLAVIPALNPDTLLICPPSVKEAYWATEQALKSGAVQAVVLVLDAPYTLTQSRRFKLATEAHGARLIVILPGSVQSFNSAAQERWHLAPRTAPRPNAPRTHWQQLKNKKGSLQQMEIEQDARSVSLV